MMGSWRAVAEGCVDRYGFVALSMEQGGEPDVVGVCSEFIFADALNANNEYLGYWVALRSLDNTSKDELAELVRGALRGDGLRYGVLRSAGDEFPVALVGLRNDADIVSKLIEADRRKPVVVDLD